jgi:endonuclease/exonuclease/phosphatase family metal-dependent hydrolase
VKVLSYNIHEGGDSRLTAIAALVGQQMPDAMALLEANRRPNVERLERKLDVQLACGEANCMSHVAWLSHRPIRRWVNHRHLSLAKTLLEYEIATDEGPISLFATHLASRHEPLESTDEITTILGMLHTYPIDPTF